MLLLFLFFVDQWLLLLDLLTITILAWDNNNNRFLMADWWWIDETEIVARSMFDLVPPSFIWNFVLLVDFNGVVVSIGWWLFLSDVEIVVAKEMAIRRHVDENWIPRNASDVFCRLEMTTAASWMTDLAMAITFEVSFDDGQSLEIDSDVKVRHCQR